MGCKNVLYAVNSTSTAYTAGSTVPMGTAVRLSGDKVALNGNGALVRTGLYDVDVSATLIASGAGVVSLALYKDGAPVPGAVATATAAAAGSYVNLGITATVRECCCNARGSLTLVLTAGTATVTNMATRVVG